MTIATNNRPRLEIFDGMRGHLLIGMLVAHFSFEPGLEWLHYLHHHKLIQLYDAEFFILLAGLLVGHLWSTAYKTHELRRKFVIGRLKTIYKYYVFSALPFLVFAVAQGAPAFKSLLGVLVMQVGGWYSDILPIYFVCFILILPFALFSALNRPKLMLAFSTAIYIASQFTALNGFFGLSDGFVTFDIAAWQFLFVCALLTGQHGVKLHKMIQNANVYFIAGLLFLLVLASILIRHFYFYPDPLNPTDMLFGNAPRMGLHPTFMIRIIMISVSFAIVLIRRDLWLWPVHTIIHWYLGLFFIRNVGKYAIQMFVFHVYIMALYKVVFASSSEPVKAAFAVFWIIVFIAAPNLWILWKRTRQARNTALQPQK